MSRFDPWGKYCVIRFRDWRYGMSLNVGAVGFWEHGFHVHVDDTAINQVMALRPDLDEFEFRETIDAMMSDLKGDSMPFQPYETYYLMHQYRDMQKDMPIVLSSIKNIAAGNYPGGIKEAIEDYSRRLVLPSGAEWDIS